ncbi:hypothetical protein LCGC14_3038100 [marine sediment metagenome]|uniref:Radical SAM core domain-containing protein n=1 Tax=marine sediment metagenome TaxID=412755 RepID=A0A0F8ZGC8_9ZZZZ
MSISIPLARIGPVQKKDIARSGLEKFDEYGRTCTVWKDGPMSSDIGDITPQILEDRYGVSWEHWNRQYIVQVRCCPFVCPYCYIDNLSEGEDVSVSEMVQWYKNFKGGVLDLNVFHLMGGCPGAYAHRWSALRKELDRVGFRDTVLLTDVILVEHLCYGVKPWLHIPPRTLVMVCIKGTSFANFQANTDRNLFMTAMSELSHYVELPDVRFTLIAPNPEDVETVEELVGKYRLSVLTVKEYEVVKWRKEQRLKGLKR